MAHFIDLTGCTFDRLTVLYRDVTKPYRMPYWHCQCACGTEKVVRRDHLMNGSIRSCGCLHDGTYNISHGMSHTKEHTAWKAMKQRCYNCNYTDFHRYGGRGISVSAEWYWSFEQFYADMGPAPSKQHSVERIDNNGPYADWNCKWATKAEQANNRRPRGTGLLYDNKIFNP